MICNCCNKHISDNSNYCIYCGNEFNNIKKNQLILQYEKAKKSTDMLSLAKEGNVFAEFNSISEAISNTKKFLSSTGRYSIAKMKEINESGDKFAIALCGITSTIAYREKGLFEEIFEGFDYNEEIFNMGVKMVKYAAELGSPSAQYYLGLWYKNGRKHAGINIDVQKAYGLMKASANQSYPSALYRLGLWHFEGKDGIAKNMKLGMQLIEKAAFFDEENAIDFIKETNKMWFSDDELDYLNSDSRKFAVKLMNSISKAENKTNDVLYDERYEFYDGDINLETKERFKKFLVEDVIISILQQPSQLSEMIASYRELKKMSFETYAKDTVLDVSLTDISKKIGAPTKEIKKYIDSEMCYFEKKADFVYMQKLPQDMIDIVKLLNKNNHYSAKNILVLDSGMALSDAAEISNIRTSFKIPADEKIYYIQTYDLFKKFKEKSNGFAICERGMYFRQMLNGNYFVKWNDFVSSTIRKENDLLKIDSTNASISAEYQDIYINCLEKFKMYINLAYDKAYKPTVKLLPEFEDAFISHKSEKNAKKPQKSVAKKEDINPKTEIPICEHIESNEVELPICEGISKEAKETIIGEKIPAPEVKEEKHKQKLSTEDFYRISFSFSNSENTELTTQLDLINQLKEDNIFYDAELCFSIINISDENWERITNFQNKCDDFAKDEVLIWLYDNSDNQDGSEGILITNKNLYWVYNQKLTSKLKIMGFETIGKIKLNAVENEPDKIPLLLSIPDERREECSNLIMQVIKLANKCIL